MCNVELGYVAQLVVEKVYKSSSLAGVEVLVEGNEANWCELLSTHDVKIDCNTSFDPGPTLITSKRKALKINHLETSCERTLRVPPPY